MEKELDSHNARHPLWSKPCGPRATWDSCAKLAIPIELEWTHDAPTPVATLPELPGWRCPLWAVDSGQLFLLRPEGIWRTDLPDSARTFMLRGRIDGVARGALFVDPTQTAKVWRSSGGYPIDLDSLDSGCSPDSASPFADQVSALQKCGQDADGACLIEIDEDFRRGPLSLSRRGPWLLVSDGRTTIAYGLGESSRMWKLFESHPCRIALGSDSFTSWVPRTVLQPVTVDLSQSP